MSATNATPVQTGLRYGWAFWRAAFRRLTWRLAAASFATGFLLWHACATNWIRDYSRGFGELWISNLFSITILTASLVVAMLAADEAVRRGAPRVSTYAVAVLIGSAVGAVAQFVVLTEADLRYWRKGLRWEIEYTMPLIFFLNAATFGGLAIFAYVHLRSAVIAARTRNDADIARVQAKRRMLESQLQAMQARVEPQFLFDTLAQVRALYEHAPAVAGEVLDDLINYLRAALPHLRDSSSTLGKEISLARAYLNIVHAQRGDELALALEIPDAVSAARVPPMLLLPLVQHLLAQGGHAEGTTHALSIAAGTNGNRLRITITDRNDGFRAGSGFRESSAQLSSVASRMSALYGDAGAFRIEHDTPRGTRAILEIPYETADDGHR